MINFNESDICTYVKLKAIGPTTLAFILDIGEGYGLSVKAIKMLVGKLDSIMKDCNNTEDALVYRSVKSMLLNTKRRADNMYTALLSEQNINYLTSDKFKTKFKLLLNDISFYAAVNKAKKGIDELNRGREIRNEKNRQYKNEYIKNLTRYRLSRQLKTKNQLKEYYIRMVSNNTGKQCYFDSASNLDSYTSVYKNESGTFSSSRNLPSEDGNYIQMISRISKLGDFLEAVYAVENKRGLLDTSSDPQYMLGMMKHFSKEALLIVSYKLALIDEQMLIRGVQLISKNTLAEIAELERIFQLS